MSDVQPLWQGEVQFRRYSDTSTQGQQIVFAVEDRDALEPFIGKEGKRFMAVLVEIGDDELPVPPAPRKDQRGPLCREACDYCAMPGFQEWVYRVHAQHAGSGGESGAKNVILSLCGIRSRRELDENQDAGGEFLRLVRVPFMRWRQQQQRQRQAA